VRDDGFGLGPRGSSIYRRARGPCGERAVVSEASTSATLSRCDATTRVSASNSIDFGKRLSRLSHALDAALDLEERDML
jgi:hypothetical protein